MADATITAANVVPSASATLVKVTFGEAVTQGQPVYKKASDGLYYKADGNDSTKIPVAGIACSAVSANQPGVICTDDPAFTPGFTIAAGDVYILSATAGGVAPVADYATGSYFTTLMYGIGNNQAKIAITTSGVAKA